MNEVRTRFAPSPTGMPHIGHLRTCAYAYALAKHDKGKFILRIEDTDQKRYVAEAVEASKKMVTGFGMKWDELYVQSDRARQGLYQKFAEALVKEGKAFYCQCEAKNAKTKGYSQELRDPCRNKNLKTGAIKLLVPDGEVVTYKDFVLDKEISWKTSEVADTTLLKSDGFPTYHLAVVVDDSQMRITHILRGHDWLPSTPIHLLVYKFLGLLVPNIGHLTDILDPSGGKLSKRKGSTSIQQLEDEGYLKEAIFNFTILLGWAPKDNREFFTLVDFVNAFNVNGLQKSNPIFNKEKLDWFNGEYIRQLPVDELNSKFEIRNSKFSQLDKKKQLMITSLVRERIKKLSDFDDLAGFFFERKKVDKKLLGGNYPRHLQAAVEALEKGIPLDQVPTKSDFKVGDFFMDLRIAVTGSKFTPPINESIKILGKEETLTRLRQSLNL